MYPTPTGLASFAADPIAAIPDPADVRQMIGVRAAELSLLRQLLRIAESRSRVLAGIRNDAAADILVATNAR